MSTTTPSGELPIPQRGPSEGAPASPPSYGRERDRDNRGGGFNQDRRNGRRHRRGRGRGRRDHQQPQQPQAPPQQAPVVATGDTRGWFEPARDGGFIRRPNNSYLTEQGDAYVPPALARQFALRRADLVEASVGLDHR